MTLQVMYSIHNQPSPNVNEHTTPKTVTILAIQAESFDVKCVNQSQEVILPTMQLSNDLAHALCYFMRSPTMVVVC